MNINQPMNIKQADRLDRTIFKDKQNAITHLEKRVANAPDDYIAYFYLSQLYIEAMAFDKGITCAKECLALLNKCPDRPTPEADTFYHSTIHHVLALALIHEKAFSKALSIIREGLDRFPQSIDLLYDLTCVGFFLENPDLIIEGGEGYHIALKQCNETIVDQDAIDVKRPAPVIRDNVEDQQPTKPFDPPCTTLHSEAIFTVNFWLMTAYLSRKQFKAYEAIWKRARQPFLETPALYAQLLTLLEDTGSLAYLEDLLLSLHAHLISSNRAKEMDSCPLHADLTEWVPLAPQYQLTLSRWKEDDAASALAVTRYLETVDDYQSVPLHSLILISEFLLLQNQTQAFIDISSVLLTNYIDLPFDSIKKKEKLAAAYFLLATQQDTSEKGILTAVVCLNVAWHLTDDPIYSDGMTQLRQTPPVEPKFLPSPSLINEMAAGANSSATACFMDKVTAAHPTDKTTVARPNDSATAQNPIDDMGKAALKLHGEKKKILFLVKSGLDSFLGDLISGLSSEASYSFELKKVVVDRYEQMDQEIPWADICWFEWCDELIVYASAKTDLLAGKKVICRLHSYEAFREFPGRVNWKNIDHAIFVSKHIRDIVIDKVPHLEKEKTHIIPNGIDLTKYHFKEREPGFKIAYVGYINYKKGPMLLLHTFKAIHDHDNRYTLHIAGTFQDQRDILYYNQMIKEMNLSQCIFHDGWQENVDQWLEDKHYIISTSVLESQSLSIMEGMAKGIKPLIHNFVGAKEIYDAKYVWNTIPECISMLDRKDYRSHEYRRFIHERYALEKQLAKTIDYAIFSH